MAELERQNYYLQQQLSERQQYQTNYGPQYAAYQYRIPEQHYGPNPGQIVGALAGGVLGAVAFGGHRGYEGGYYRHGNGALGFLTGSLIGGALAGGNNYQSDYYPPPPPPMNAWNTAQAYQYQQYQPGYQYQYRHESPMQRYYEQQREMAMLRRQQSYNYNYNYSGYDY